MKNLGGLLRYGAIGLGLALAFLAFELIKGGCGRVDPSYQTTIYVFMGFALCLVALGFTSEIVTNQRVARLKQRLSETQKTIKSLLEVKALLVESDDVAEVRSQLKKIDEEIGKALS